MSANYKTLRLVLKTQKDTENSPSAHKTDKLGMLHQSLFLLASSTGGFQRQQEEMVLMIERYVPAIPSKVD